MPEPQPDLVLLHLSDLHFGPYLPQTERYGEWSGMAAPHDFSLLQGMESILLQLIADFQDRLYVIVTGDLTTAAEPPAYVAVNNYLRDLPFFSRTGRIGLNLKDALNDRILTVPGNHDIWFYGSLLTRWKNFKDRRLEYDRYFKFESPTIHPLVLNGFSVTFYSLDSNRVKKFLKIFNLGNVLGKGEVGSDQIKDMRDEEEGIGERAVPPGYDHASSLKIAILHHHLAPPSGRHKNIKDSILELRDRDDVKELLLELNVRLVLCGHQHEPYQLPKITLPQFKNRRLFMSCAGSASQLDLPKNSFYVYKIFKKDPESYDMESVLYTASSKKKRFNFKVEKIKRNTI